jgi:hypothetical protein
MMNLNKTNPASSENVYTISIARANFIALLLIIPESLLFVTPFFIKWGVNVLTALRFKSLLFLLLFIILGAAIHELLHGIAWAIATRTGFRYIRFGLKWEYLTPYCHYVEAMKVWQYITGGIAPLVVMGIMPAIWAMSTGNALIMFFALFFTWAAGGDIQAVWMLGKFHRNQMIYDHPEELGFVIKDNLSDKQ